MSELVGTDSGPGESLAPESHSGAGTSETLDPCGQGLGGGSEGAKGAGRQEPILPEPGDLSSTMMVGAEGENGGGGPPLEVERTRRCGAQATPLSAQIWPAEWSAHRVAAARFIAHLWTRLRGRWRGGGSTFPSLWRPPVHCRCAYGQNLAGPEEFEAQAARAREVAAWDRAQAHLLQRLESGRAPFARRAMFSSNN